MNPELLNLALCGLWLRAAHRHRGQPRALLFAFFAGEQWHQFTHDATARFWQNTRIRLVPS